METLNETTLAKIVKENVADKIEIEVGDSKQVDFKPQVKIMRWDNEVNFSMRAEEKAGATHVVENGVSKYITPDYEVHQYEKPEVSEDGGYEFEWVLKSKPKSNLLSATIQTKELDFFYQPALTAEEIEQGSERPENVVGSYAVYHSSKKNNVVGGKEYKTGKAFHIYRPEAVDADGNKTWCEIHIDTGAGLLTVTVPEKFLAKAVYPIVVDPTFGYTTAGGTIFSSSAKTKYVKATPSTSGDITKFTMYINWNFSGTGDFPTALYSDTSNLPNSQLATATLLNTASGVSWKDTPISYTIVGSTKYWIGLYSGSTRYQYYYDTGGVSEIDTVSASLPATATPGGTETNRNYSIYATYTAASSYNPAFARRHLMV